jgi:hypothetical protein
LIVDLGLVVVRFEFLNTHAPYGEPDRGQVYARVRSGIIRPQNGSFIGFWSGIRSALGR